jgi:hypothetical protein
MISITLPIPAVYYSITKEIYEFLDAVKQCQFKVRDKEISVYYELLHLANNDNNVEYRRWVESLGELAISIHTDNGYISALERNGLLYSLHPKYNLSLPLICKNDWDVESKMEEFFEHDLISLGFDGDTKGFSAYGFDDRK